MRRRLTFTLVALAAVGMAPAAAAAAPAPGDVFIADTLHNRVVEVPAGGGAQTVVNPGNITPTLDHPSGVAVDPEGQVYISDTYNDRVLEPGPDGAFVLIDGPFSFPMGLAVTPDGGTVWLADSGDNQVVPLSPAAGVTGLASPDGVAVDIHGNVYIANSAGNSVLEKPAGGGALTNVGAGFAFPEGLAVDVQGDVYVADYNNNRVIEVPAGGGPETTVGTGFSHPTAVALDAAGDLFVADSGNNRVVEIPAAGGAQTTVGTGLLGPAGVAVYAPPPSYTADSPPAAATAGAAYSYTFAANAPTGEPAATFALASGSLPPGLSLDPVSGKLSGTPTRAGTFSFAVRASNAVMTTTGATHSITVSIADGGTAGDVYIADTFGNRVVKLAAADRTQSYPLTGLNRPSAVAVDNHGDLFVADTSNNQVIETFAVGGAQTTWGSGLNVPTGVAVDTQGNVYIADRGNNRVLKEPANGGAQTTVGTGLNAPQGVAVDALGDVFIADRGNNRVVELPAGGGAQTTVGSGLNAPQGVAVDGHGNVFIADGGNARVVEVPAGGGVQTTVGTGLSHPASVALDAQGDLYIADPVPAGSIGNDVVEVPADGGPQTTVGSGLSLPTGVAAFAPPPAFTADNPPNARQGDTYSYTYTATPPAGEPAPTFAVASGSLPPGMSLDPSSGELSGPPTTLGNYTFRVDAENGATRTLGVQNTITIGALPTAGDVFIADHDNFVLELPVGGGVTTVGNLGSGVPDPRGLAVAGNEDVYVADAGKHRVLRISGDTQVQTEVHDADIFSVDPDDGPYGVAADSAGNVYIANTVANYIDKVRPNGTLDNSFSGSSFKPQGVAVDTKGDVFIADTGDDLVREIFPDGTNQLVGSGLSGPAGVAVDTKGDVYIADSDNNRVVEVPAGGGPQVTVYTQTGADPTGVALDASGNLYIADFGYSRIYVEPADGGSQTTLPWPVGPVAGRSDYYWPYGVAVYAPPPTFAGDHPPDAILSRDYSYTYGVHVPANEPQPTFRVASGSLPPGLSLDHSTGELSGTPTTLGTYSFAIETENAVNATTGATRSLTVGPVRNTLTTAKAGSGSGTVTSSPSGIDCGSNCSAAYDDGTQVTLTATPASGSRLTGWSGGGCSGTGTCTVTMSSDQTVTATFDTIPASQHALTVAKAGSGSGTVTSSPSGIDCGSSCSAAYDQGTQVTLTATPASGSRLTGWSGGGCSGTGTCTVTMSSDKTVMATFDTIPPDQHTLTVAKAGSGSGTVTSSPSGIDCGASCSAAYDDGTHVTLTATPASGSQLTGWSGGGCSGTGTCTVTMSSDLEVTATFSAGGADAPQPQAPVLSALRVSPNKLVLTGRRVAGRCLPTTHLTAKNKHCTRPVSGTIHFRLSMAAHVRMTITHRLPGRLVGRHCVTPSRSNHRHAQCTQQVHLSGALTASGHEGANSVAFDGRIGGHNLAPGTYELTAIPTADGRTGAARTVMFEIAR